MSTETKKRLDQVTIQDAKIIFRNFAGRKREFNEEGDRNFTLVLPPDIGKRMMIDGWNVKEKTPWNADEGDETKEYHLKVFVEYRKGRPPRCMLVKPGQEPLDLGADEVGLIDYAELENVDLTLNPYSWGPNARGESGVKAYLKTIFVKIHQDPLDEKYGLIKDPMKAADPYDDDEEM